MTKTKNISCLETFDLVTEICNIVGNEKFMTILMDFCQTPVEVVKHVRKERFIYRMMEYIPKQYKFRQLASLYPCTYYYEYCHPGNLVFWATSLLNTITFYVTEKNPMMLLKDANVNTQIYFSIIDRVEQEYDIKILEFFEIDKTQRPPFSITLDVSKNMKTVNIMRYMDRYKYPPNWYKFKS